MDHTTQNEDIQNPHANPRDRPAADNPNGTSPVPQGTGPEDVSEPYHIIGNGTSESCSGEAFYDAVSKGGKTQIGFGN